jgi:hypothetical protein
VIDTTTNPPVIPGFCYPAPVGSNSLVINYVTPTATDNQDPTVPLPPSAALLHSFGCLVG